MFYGDSLGFLGARGGPIVVEDGLKLNLVHLTATPPWINTMEETLVEIENFKEMIFKQPKLRLVMNQKDLSSAIADEKIAVILGMQNTPDDIGTGSSGLEPLMKAGIRIVSPCYGKRNNLGSGWLNAGVGITSLGELFLRRCCWEGIMVDLSHCGHEMARDIISYIRSRDENNDELFRKIKLIASHGGCYSQYHHFRNLPDDVLKDVAELGGIVGISTLTFTSDERDNSVFPFKDHLVRAITLCGEDSVCVGSDDLYITRDIEEVRKQFEIMSKKLDPLGTQGARFPENPISVMGPNMLEKLHKFSIPYFPVGIPEKVFGQNLLNFFARALPAK